MQVLNSVNTALFSKWFKNLFMAGWQNLEALFPGDTVNLAPSLRSNTAPNPLLLGEG